MKQTVVGVFDGYAKAQQAAQQLRDSGFGDSVFVTEESASASSMDAAARDTHHDGVLAHVRHFFADLFGADDEAAARPYADVVGRGGAVVKVEVDEEHRATQARAALQAAGAIDLAGEAGSSASAVSRPGFGEMAQRDDMTGTNLNAELPAMPDMAADIEMPLGQTSLDRPSEATLARGSMEAAREPSQFDDTRFLVHYQANYASTGGTYEEYDPAYRYGARMRGDSRHAGRPWEVAEADMRRDWESSNPGSPWERFGAAVRHGWDRGAA